MFADDLTETLLVQMIHTMGENGVNIGNKSFIQDIGFVVESVKSTIYRDMGLQHPMRGIMEVLSKVTTDDKQNHHSEVDLDLVEKLSQDMMENEEPEPPKIS